MGSRAMAKKRVAVTGGSGRVGEHIVKILLDHGHQVINVDRRQAEKPLTKMVYCDLRQRELLQPVLDQVEAVIHLAEIPHMSAPYSPDYIFAHNIAATSCVLQTAADLGLERVIYTSSCQIYGMWGGQGVRPEALPMDEKHPVKPRQAYAMSKLANEQYAAMVAELHGLSVAAFRLPGVITWWPTAEQMKKGQGYAWRFRGKLEEFGTYVHAEDVATAYLAALERPKQGFEVYHLSAREVMSPAPLRQQLKIDYPDWPELPPDWPAFKSPMICDKAKAHLDWDPTWNMLEVYREAFGRDPGP
jgi:nucleoside-diphosphate-sugar epimerase